VVDKTFAERLAALEAIEAGHVEQAASELPPALESLSDDVAVWCTIEAWRCSAMKDGLYNAGTTAIQFHCGALRSSIAHYDAWVAFYNALGQRVNALIQASGQPFIPLAGWEVEDAIALIDAGRCDAVPLWPSAHPSHPGAHYALRLDRGFARSVDDEDTIKAVNQAKRLLSRQLGYPDSGAQAWEMLTVGEWRAWLAALIEAVP